jgi:hypothetical protein
MRSLAELKRRQADRKLRDVPLAKLFGPDQAIQDLDTALDQIDQLKECLRNIVVSARNNRDPELHALLDQAIVLCE